MSVRLCVQHYDCDAAHSAGLSAATESLRLVIFLRLYSILACRTIAVSICVLFFIIGAYAIGPCCKHIAVMLVLLYRR